MKHQEIKEFIIHRKEATLADISSHFSIPSEQLKTFLDLWVKNGSLNKTTSTGTCQKKTCGCNVCAVSLLEIYSWKNK
jgi:hypothetical protein